MTARRTRTAFVGGAVALVAAGSLAGCAGQQAGQSLALTPVAAVKAALDSTTAVTSAAFTAKVTADGQTIELAGRESLGTPAKAEVTTTVAGTKVQVRAIGGTVYLQLGALAGMLGGTSWVKLDAAGSDAAKGLGLESLLSQAQQDPRKMLELLTASGDLTAVGTETLGGEQVTHYAGTVDVAKSLGDLPAEVRSGISALVKKSGVTAIKVDAWVGADHLPRRITESMSSPAGPATADVTFSNYNAPVDVVAPPADQTRDLSSLTSGLAGLGDALQGLLGG
jgi:hypothetical protein